MTKRIILYGALVLLLTLTARAQTLTVRDNVSGQPLEGAMVTADNHIAIGEDGRANASLRRPAFTDAGGRADLSPFAETKADRLRVQLIGYRPAIIAREQWIQSAFTLYLERAPLNLDDVVVSATRWKQPERDVPQRSVRIRDADVQLSNPQTAADLLASSGEVAVQKSQLAGGSPMIRGFATNRVLIAVDGVRMNTAIFRSGNVQNVISLDPLATERTEVLFGPGSVMYGSDAIGGVMSFQTLAPRFSQPGRTLFSGHAMLRGSSANGEKTGHADLLLGLERWGFASSVSYSDFGDLTMGSHGPDAYLRTRMVENINGIDSIVANDDPEKQTPSGYSQLNLLQKIRYRPSDAWDVTYGFQYSATSDYSRYDRLLRPKGSLLRSAEWYYGPQIWMLHSLTATNSAGSVLWDEASATAAYQYFKESRHDRDYRKTALYHRTERVDAYSANLDFTKLLAPAHSISYGAELLLNRVGSTGEDENTATGVTVPGSTRYPDGAAWSSIAAYTNYRWAALEALSLQAGLRYSHVALDADFDTTFFPFPFTSASMSNGALNGSFGAVFTPLEMLRFNAVLSSGFRAPNVDDVGKVFDSSPGYVVVPNPDLKPEYAYNAELGMTVLADDAVKLDVTGFTTLLRDALVKRNFTLNGMDSIMYDGELSQVQAMQNAAEAYVRGVQARVELRLPAGFGVTSHVTFMRGTEQMDDGSTGTLRHAPPMFGSTHVTYTRHRLEVDCSADYSDEVSAQDLAPGLEGRDYLYALDGNGLPYVPSWYTLNLKARYMLSEAVQVTAGVENILDQRYRTYASGITAAGRNITAALRLAF